MDIHEDRAIPVDEGKSVGFTLVQKSTLFTFCWTSALNKVVDLDAVHQYYACPYSNTVTLGP